MSHPPRYDKADPLLHRVRELCLGLPGAQERVSHGRPTFFTRKVFAIFGGVVKGEHHSAALRRAIVVLPSPAEREALIQDSRFVVPAYEGAFGWLALPLDRGGLDWAEVAELIEESYRQTAPASLVRELDAR